VGRFGTSGTAWSIGARAGMHMRAVAESLVMVQETLARLPEIGNVSLTVLVHFASFAQIFHRLSTANPQSFSQIIYSNPQFGSTYQLCHLFFFLQDSMRFFTLAASYKQAAFYMKGEHYSKESVVLEQQSTASDTLAGSHIGSTFQKIQ